MSPEKIKEEKRKETNESQYLQNKEESHVTYTLMMVDPDAPTPDDPKFAFWRHWIVTGLQPPSGESSVVSISNLHPVTQYHPPGPKAE